MRFRIGKYYIVFFILLLLFPLFMTISGLGIDVKINEKRAKVEKPQWQGSIKRYIKQYNKFFENNYFGRDVAIYVYNNLRFYFLKESPIPENVILGKSKWLFYCNKQDGDSIVDYQGLIRLTDEELNKIFLWFKNLQDWLDERKIKFYFIVAPDKQTIYFDKLPDKIKKTDKTAADQIIPYLKNKGIHVIDLRDSILQKKFSYDELYYKTDTHWNRLGAYFGYCEIIEELKKTFRYIKPVNFNLKKIQYTDYHNGGDLVEMMGVNFPYFRDAVFSYPTNYKIINKDYTGPDTNRAQN